MLLRHSLSLVKERSLSDHDEELSTSKSLFGFKSSPELKDFQKIEQPRWLNYDLKK